jgi:branched-subunit amino acid transport protein
MRWDIISIILGMAAVTLLTRSAGLVWHSFGKNFSRYENFLRPIPIAVLTALVVPSLLMPDGRLHISIYNPYLIAGAFALLLAYKTRNVFITVALGMAMMLSLRYFGL